MRPNPVVVRATDELAVLMAPHLRLVDCREIRANADPLAIIRGSLAMSSHAWAWMRDGEPACMFGVCPRSLAGGVGVAWLLATDAIRLDLRTFLLGSRLVLDHMLAIYPRLEGAVDARFIDSVRWLERLGFQISEPRDFRGVPFRPFEVTRGSGNP